MEEFFRKDGWPLADDFKKADIILFSACGLTEVKEDASLEVLRQINAHKKPSAEVIVCGCFPKINNGRIRQVHQGIIFNSDEAERLEEFFESKIKARDIRANLLGYSWRSPHLRPFNIERLLNIFNLQSRSKNRKWSRALNRVSFVDHDTFFIKVCTGCLDNCTFCGVRFARGILRSKPIQGLISEFQEGLEKNYRKFTLIGTDLGAYGRDRATDLVALLSSLMQNAADFKLRLPNLNPRWLIKMLRELRDLVGSGKIEVIGSGFQSGSNRILKLMNRKYTIEDYKQAMLTLRTAFPDLRLRTNIVVGFPSERESDFQETVRILNEVDFAYADVHRYSKRPNTKAAIMPGQVPREVVEDRVNRLKQAFSRHIY
jgi:threonylcarbamoyladenosine tRNA methylthiotransferase MtaB